MREIKFRGKTLDGAKWVYGSLIITRLLHGSKYEIKTLDTADEEDEPNSETIEVYYPTIGQFTGLSDCNGVEIYDEHELNKSFGVRFEDGAYVVYNISSNDILTRLTEESINENGFEITGEYTKMAKDKARVDY